MLKEAGTPVFVELSTQLYGSPSDTLPASTMTHLAASAQLLAVTDNLAHEGLLPKSMPIATEALTAVLCWIGAYALLRKLTADARAFNRAKAFAVAGLTLGFLLWQVGVMTIGGEWFGMWQSKSWDGVPSAFRFVMVIMAVLIVVALPDGEVETQGKS
jgi:predicted small integral membrane protein